MFSLPVDRRWRVILMIVMLGALTVRVGAAIGLQYLLDHRWQRAFLIEGDAEGYWLLAQTIANGETYSVYTPPRYALRMPGFPALLAVPITLVGPSLFAARITLALVGTFACWLTYLLGKRVVDEKVGVIAAALAAFSPTLIVFSVEPLCETAFAAMLLWSLLCGHALFQRLSATSLKWSAIVGLSLLTGVAIAAGVYQRPSWILASPIVAGLLFLTVPPGRRLFALIAGGLVVTGMVLALLPWGLRNQAVTGHFTFTTFWMGPSLYDGLNPEATGDSDMRFFDRDALLGRMSEYEVDQYYRKAAKEFAISSPVRVLELAVVKAWRYWKPWPNADQFQHPIAIFSVLVTYLPVLLFSIWGAVLLIKRSLQTGALREGIWSVSILAGPIFYFALLHLIFVSSLRYRLPTEYPLFVLAGVGIVAFTTRWKSSKY
ncbi:MAG TPA: glycosyltransferase family 39 protein [Planctomicrobium sp.]|nr:glycosyltransferase family 39 protein [Planctomicrobium sp.]